MKTFKEFYNHKMIYENSSQDLIPWEDVLANIEKYKQYILMSAAHWMKSSSMQDNDAAAEGLPTGHELLHQSRQSAAGLRADYNPDNPNNEFRGTTLTPIADKEINEYLSLVKKKMANGGGIDRNFMSVGNDANGRTIIMFSLSKFAQLIAGWKEYHNLLLGQLKSHGTFDGFVFDPNQIQVVGVT